MLGRPQNAQPLVDSIHAATLCEHRILFVCSAEDRMEVRACQRTGAGMRFADWPPGAGDYARKINAGFAETEEPFVLLGADDLRFHPGWDEAVLAEAERTGAGVIGTQDGWNPVVKRGRHATHPVVRRSYIEASGGTFDEEPGVVYYEGYDHQSVDNELVAVAQARREWAFAFDARVEHLHPMARKAQMDATYRKGLARGREDFRLYAARRREWERASKAH